MPSSVWHLSDPERLAGFRRTTQSLRLRRGQGLPGRVLDTGRPAWIGDLGADVDFPRSEWAVEAGLSAAFAFPILAGREVVGVLEFLQANESYREMLGSPRTRCGPLRSHSSPIRPMTT